MSDIEVHAEFPQREVIQAHAVVGNTEKTVSEVIISAKPEITGVTASVDNETGTPYVDVTETGTGTDFSFDLAFHNLKGDTGETGQTGATGNGIATISNTSTSGLVDTYTITFTNGNSTTFTVTNGNGISDISKTSTSGLADTYTITYDNGDTDTFTVTNGKDGIDGQDGTDGQAATITVGTTTTGQAGTNASVVNSGTSSAAILDFTIPRGDTGATGVSVTGVSLISTSGLQKTYRMTFSDNSYYDYIVTDGASGSTAWGGISGTLSNQTDLQTELTGLQSQIDAIVSSSDVFDIVGTYAELQAYNISTVPVNDIIKVLVDSTHSNAATYYRCVENGGVKSWSYIGSEGAYYTKSEADTLLNAKQNTIGSNNKLSVNYIDGLAAVATSGSYNDLLNKPTIPDTSNLANEDLSNLTATGEAHFQEPLVSGTNIKTINNTSILGSGDLTVTASITSSDIINALGYTPQDSTTAVTHSANTPVGSATRIMYIASNGTATPSETTVGSNTTPIYLSGGTITSTGVSIASSRFDGQWTAKEKELSTSTEIDSYTLDLSSYLPNTTSTYEVMVAFTISAKATAVCNTKIYSDKISITPAYMRQKTSSTSHSIFNSMLLVIPVQRYLYFSITNRATDSTNITAVAYRRLGTNS